MGIEDKDGAWACESVSAKSDESSYNNNIFKKIKN